MFFSNKVFCLHAFVFFSLGFTLEEKQICCLFPEFAGKIKMFNQEEKKSFSGENKFCLKKIFIWKKFSGKMFIYLTVNKNISFRLKLQAKLFFFHFVSFEKNSGEKYKFQEKIQKSLFAWRNVLVKCFLDSYQKNLGGKKVSSGVVGKCCLKKVST